MTISKAIDFVKSIDPKNVKRFYCEMPNSCYIIVSEIFADPPLLIIHQPFQNITLVIQNPYTTIWSRHNIDNFTCAHTWVHFLPISVRALAGFIEVYLSTIIDTPYFIVSINCYLFHFLAADFLPVFIV